MRKKVEHTKYMKFWDLMQKAYITRIADVHSEEEKEPTKL